MRSNGHTPVLECDCEEIRIPSGSRKSMLIHLALELWKRDRLNIKRLIEAQGREVRYPSQALKYLRRSSTQDLEILLAESLNGDRVVVEGPLEVLGTPERELLSRLGVELPTQEEAPQEEHEQIRFIDMTPALLGFAAIIMALRYLALGLSDRELYVMAGIGYAAFILIRTFSYKLKRPKNAPPLAVR